MSSGKDVPDFTGAIIQFIKEPCGIFLPDHSMNGPWGNYMRCGNTFSGLLFLICMIVCFLITPCFAGQAMSDNGTLPYIGALKPGSISGPGVYYVPVLTKIQGNYSDTLKSHDMSYRTGNITSSLLFRTPITSSSPSRQRCGSNRSVATQGGAVGKVCFTRETQGQFKPG